jgi:protein-tyrosine phosphatase
MLKSFKLIKKGLDILVYRLHTQGVGVTLIWIYGRGIPFITGVPILKYSRITPQIYVGPQYRQAGKRKLEQSGINGDVNLRIEFDDAAHGLALENYCHLPTVDDTAPTLDHLQQGVAFIRQVTSAGGKVYIHCAGGVGRAPTMAAAYFISQGLSLEDALILIKKTRPFIKITPEQMEQLERFERTKADKAVPKK